MRFNDFTAKLYEFAPLELSKAMVEKGSHDNSGVILKLHDEVEKVLFALDLTESAVLKAVKANADTIVTHHPAIFYPILRLELGGENSALAMAAFYGLNVISLHLNLDIAKGGIDDQLAQAFSPTDVKVIEFMTKEHGYGREFKVEKTTISDIVETMKSKLKAVNITVFSKGEKVVKKVASFCGGGSSHAVKYDGNADLIITSDMPHHIILSMVESGKAVVLITHYTAEMFGFKKFADYCSKFIETVVFDDKRYY